MLLPMLANATNSVDVTAIVSQAVGGGVAGAVLTGIIVLIKNKTAS
jgi:hypothetical protein